MIWLTISNSKMFTWWWALYWFWSRYVVLFCNSFMFYFLYNLFLESNFVLWSDGSIQLCQFNFHSWQFDRLFVPKLVYHETLFLQLKILSKVDGTEQTFEKNRRSFHLQRVLVSKLYPKYAYIDKWPASYHSSDTFNTPYVLSSYYQIGIFFTCCLSIICCVVFS